MSLFRALIFILAAVFAVVFAEETVREKKGLGSGYSGLNYGGYYGGYPYGNSRYAGLGYSGLGYGGYGGLGYSGLGYSNLGYSRSGYSRALDSPGYYPNSYGYRNYPASYYGNTRYQY